MKLSVLLAVPLLAVATWAAPELLHQSRVQADQVRVQPDQGHVASSRLEGRWELHPTLNESLGGRPPFEALEFTSDDSAVSDVPEMFIEALAEMRVWQAGVMTGVKAGTKQSSPYLMVTHTGNTTIIRFRATQGEELDDAESNLITLVPALERAEDLLFLGGDFNNEPFTAFRRTRETD